MRRLGVGYRRELAAWIESRPPQIDCLEITAEHFFDAPAGSLRGLRRRYPLFVHSLSVSLGTPGPMDRAAVDALTRVVADADPLWISEHIAFTRTSEVDLGHLNPVAATEANIELIAAHARELSDRCGKPLILENITSHLRLSGDMEETDFINALCDRARCGILLDVTNLYVNSRNHGFDPTAWLSRLDPARIVQLHVVGYSVRDGVLEDLHAANIQQEILDLTREVFKRAPVEAVIIERDGRFPPVEQLVRELELLRASCGDAYALR